MNFINLQINSTEKEKFWMLQKGSIYAPFLIIKVWTAGDGEEKSNHFSQRSKTFTIVYLQYIRMKNL